MGRSILPRDGPNHTVDATPDEVPDQHDVLMRVLNIRAGVRVTREDIFEEIRRHRISFALDLLAQNEIQTIDYAMSGPFWRADIPEDPKDLAGTQQTWEFILNEKVLPRLETGDLPTKARDFLRSLNIENPEGLPLDL